MKQRKIPLRKCTGCGRMMPKKELVRVVRLPDVTDSDGAVVSAGSVELDFTGKKPGRGAYICRDISCLAMAKKARRLERAFSCQIPPELYAAMEKELTEDE